MLDIKSSGYMKDVINLNEARATMFECVFHLLPCKHDRGKQYSDRIFNLKNGKYN